MLEKLKSLISHDNYFLLLAVVLLILLAFQLGHLSASQLDWYSYEEGKSVELIATSTSTDDTLTITKSETTSESVVASQNGERYYPLDCSTHQRISIENRLYFATEEKARAGGYSRSKNCW